MIAREIEQAGVSTTSISMVRQHTERVKPPRALFVPFPFGHPLGKPHDPAGQLAVMRAALALLERPSGPVLEDYSEDVFEGQDINLPQAASVNRSAPRHEIGFELSQLRPYYEQRRHAHGRTNVGLTGVRPGRFSALVRLLEAYARGEDQPDIPEWNRDAPLPQFVRWAADDLKAFYLEARMQQHPSDSFQELNRWLWEDTALSQLLVGVRNRMKATGDPALDAISFGIAR